MGRHEQAGRTASRPCAQQPPKATCYDVTAMHVPEETLCFAGCPTEWWAPETGKTRAPTSRGTLPKILCSIVLVHLVRGRSRSRSRPVTAAFRVRAEQRGLGNAVVPLPGFRGSRQRQSAAVPASLSDLRRCCRGARTMPEAAGARWAARDPCTLPGSNCRFARLARVAVGSSDRHQRAALAGVFR